MENNNSLKIILYIVLGLMVVQLLYMFFGINQNLNNALNKLKETQVDLSTALQKVNESKLRIDSIQNDISNFSKYVDDIQGRAQILDLERRKNDQLFSSKRDSIRTKLKELYAKYGIKEDSLPDIKPVDL